MADKSDPIGVEWDNTLSAEPPQVGEVVRLRNGERGDSFADFMVIEVRGNRAVALCELFDGGFCQEPIWCHWPTQRQISIDFAFDIKEANSHDAV